MVDILKYVFLATTIIFGLIVFNNFYSGSKSDTSIEEVAQDLLVGNIARVIIKNNGQIILLYHWGEERFAEKPQNESIIEILTYQYELHEELFLPQYTIFEVEGLTMFATFFNGAEIISVNELAYHINSEYVTKLEVSNNLIKITYDDGKEVYSSKESELTLSRQLELLGVEATRMKEIEISTYSSPANFLYILFLFSPLISFIMFIVSYRFSKNSSP